MLTIAYSLQTFIIWPIDNYKWRASGRFYQFSFLVFLNFVLIRITAENVTATYRYFASLITIKIISLFGQFRAERLKHSILSIGSHSMLKHWKIGNLSKLLMQKSNFWSSAWTCLQYHTVSMQCPHCTVLVASADAAPYRRVAWRGHTSNAHRTAPDRHHQSFARSATMSQVERTRSEVKMTKNFRHVRTD